jgi:hypothetical protein
MAYPRAALIAARIPGAGAPGRPAGGGGAWVARRGAAAAALLPRLGRPAAAAGGTLLGVSGEVVVVPAQPEVGRERAEQSLALRGVPAAGACAEGSGRGGCDMKSIAAARARRAPKNPGAFWEVVWGGKRRYLTERLSNLSGG